MKTFLFSSAVLVTTWGTATGCAIEPSFARSCTEMACGTGSIVVQFSYTGAAEYRFEIDIDGVRHECTASLPLRANAPRSCDDATLGLVLSGSALPAAEHSIGPLQIARDDAERVAVCAYRDDALIGETAFDVEYSTTPGPNGEGCGPAICRHASGGSL